MKPPLHGTRVVDLTQVMAGPWCTQLLADLGADVIKVEPVSGGDQARTTMGAPGPGDTPGFRAVNRNKRSLAVDLKTDRGRSLVHRLAAHADVLVESLRPGVAQRLGVDHETLHQVNPRLVVTSLTGFGDRGELADRPGYDLVAQAMTGLMSVTGTVGGDPVKCGVPVTDLTSGLLAVVGTLAALRSRDSSGVGQHVGTSLYQAGLALLVWETAALWSTGRVPEPTGSAHRLLAPYEALRTKDGWITVAANTERLWRLLCETLGCEALVADPRFATNADRVAHRAELAVELERRLVTDGTEAWLARLVGVGFPAAPVRSVAEALADPHTRAIGMVGAVEHPVVGPHPVLGVPLQLTSPVSWPGRAAPVLGQHTREVLAQLGFADEEVDALHEAGVVHAP